MRIEQVGNSPAKVNTAPIHAQWDKGLDRVDGNSDCGCSPPALRRRGVAQPTTPEGAEKRTASVTQRIKSCLRACESLCPS